jgi:pimeloyl-ACP methyl ester carboxylesterase
VAGAAAIDAALEAHSAERRYPPIGRFMEIEGTDVHYIDQGEGPPVVLLHGNGTMIHDWVLSGVLDELARHHRVIAIDRPGYGYTSRPRSRVWTPYAQAELVRGVVQELGVERPVVLGHSWGTMVALAYALEHRHETAGLVLLSGYYFGSARMDVWVMSPPAIPVLGDLMRYTISPPLGRLLAPKLVRKTFAPQPVPQRFHDLFPLPLALRPSQLRASAADSALMVPEAVLLSRRIEELKGLPVQIIVGEGDEIVTAKDQSMRLHDELPGSTLQVLPRTGHMLHYTAQRDIAEAVATITGADKTRAGGVGRAA